MDGLLLDSEPVYRMSWQRAAADLGIPLSDAFYLTLVGISNQDAEAILEQTYGARFSARQFRQRWTRYWDEHVREHGLPLKPGVTELLAFLEQRRTPKAVATSTAHAEALHALRDLAGRFDCIVTGDMVARGKPAPDIFLMAAQRLRLPPERCLALEDSEAGVIAAHAAGMTVIMVPDRKQPSPDVAAQAQCVCASLDAVRELLGARVSPAARQA